MGKTLAAGTLAEAIGLIGPTMSALGRRDGIVALAVDGKRVLVPDSRVRRFASTFRKKDSLVLIEGHGDPLPESEEELAGMYAETFLGWENGEMILSSAWELRSMAWSARRNLIEFDLDELASLASEDEKRAAKVERLVKKLLPEGETPVPPKPSPEAKLAAKEKALAREEEQLVRAIAINKKLATLSTERLERAEALYRTRKNALRRAVREAGENDGLTGDTVREVLKMGRTWTEMSMFPPELFDKLSNIFRDIPTRHAGKRRRAAVMWYAEARGWLDRVSGKPHYSCYPSTTMRHVDANTSDAHVKEEWGTIAYGGNAGADSLYWAKNYDLDFRVRDAKNYVLIEEERLSAVRQELCLVRLKLAFPKKPKRVLVTNNKPKEVAEADESNLIRVVKILGEEVTLRRKELNGEAAA